MNNDNSLTKILAAIDLLKKQKRQLTYNSIGELCDMSKQRVHSVMRANGMNTGRKHDRDYAFLSELDRIRTDNLTVKQIAVIVGYTKSIARLRSILHDFNIPCQRASARTSVKSLLNSIPTENYTIDQLYDITKYSHSKHSFRSFIRLNKIKYQKVRSVISNQLTSDENLL